MSCRKSSCIPWMRRIEIVRWKAELNRGAEGPQMLWLGPARDEDRPRSMKQNDAALVGRNLAHGYARTSPRKASSDRETGSGLARSSRFLSGVSSLRRSSAPTSFRILDLGFWLFKRCSGYHIGWCATARFGFRGAVFHRHRSARPTDRFRRHWVGSVCGSSLLNFKVIVQNVPCGTSVSTNPPPILERDWICEKPGERKISNRGVVRPINLEKAGNDAQKDTKNKGGTQTKKDQSAW